MELLRACGRVLRRTRERRPGRCAHGHRVTTDLPVCLREAPEQCRSVYSFVFVALCWEKIGVTRKAFWDLMFFPKPFYKMQLNIDLLDIDL